MMAFMRVLAMALALASSTAWTSHPFESARNQYEVREDRAQLPQLHTEDRPEVHSTKTKSALFDLQVGCGDGHIHENLQHPSETDKNKVTSKRRSRRRRSYTPWSGQVVYSEPYPSIAVWKPPIYQMSRPYYIPIFGVAGKPPIFFPPQPLLINPGVPQDNPVKPFQGPSYLPPPQPTTESPTTMKIDDRFNGSDDVDDRPIWDIGGNDVAPTTTTGVVPTRRPRPPGAPKTHPPLIHNPTGGQPSQSQNTVDSDFRPPPPSQSQQQPSGPGLASPSPPNEPSRCVWAIISCCSTTGQISYDCFEQRGCSGPFWDNNPCDNEYAKAAISAALNYYESK